MKAAARLREAERARSLRRRSIAAQISCCSTTTLSGCLLSVSSSPGRFSPSRVAFNCFGSIERLPTCVPSASKLRPALEVGKTLNGRTNGQ
jgi:hypothetical protein